MEDGLMNFGNDSRLVLATYMVYVPHALLAMASKEHTRPVHQLFILHTILPG